MKVLLIGSGGREHAIALAVRKSSLCSELFFAPGNPGLEALGTCITANVADPVALANIAEQLGVGLTIVGPEIPLVAGVVDEFRRRGLFVFGPTAAAAALEGSKAFSKNIMKKYGVPTAAYETFNDLAAALDFLAAHPAPIVVKASGLAAGKGAIVCSTDDEARQAVEEMLGEKAIFGESGKTVVIEEFMEGEEASVFAVCDGKDYVVLAPAQDHKRVFDNDLGPNTGGMGAYAPAPVMTDALMAQVCQEVIEPTLKGMQVEGIPYTGVLFVGVMVTPQGPKVVEYNCRFGDPETQVVLPLYDGDVLQLLLAASQGAIATLPAPRKPKGSAAVIVLASAGYPGNYEVGKVVHGIEKAEATGAQVLHAGTKRSNGVLQSAGGRVFGVVGSGETLKAALDQAYAGASEVVFEGCFYRKDIGKRGLEKCLN